MIDKLNALSELGKKDKEQARGKPTAPALDATAKVKPMPFVPLLKPIAGLSSLRGIGANSGLHGLGSHAMKSLSTLSGLGDGLLSNGKLGLGK